MTNKFNIKFKTILESFNSNSFDLDRAYELFKAEYEASTGNSWSYNKFINRASQWKFYGDSNGFVAVREQNSGFVKLVGAAGSDKSKYKGFKELMATGSPVWGAVDGKILNILEKIGWIKSPTLLVKILIPQVKIIFGDVDVKINKDGSLTLTYPDVGTVTKFFIGTPEYYKKLLFSDQIKLPKILKNTIYKLITINK